MITSLFKKSTPLNYTIVVTTALVVFLLFLAGRDTATLSWLGAASIVVFLFASLFIVNFIAKKNNLSRDSTFTVLFYVLFVMFFPGILDKPRLMLAGFFVLLALRRLISMHSFKAIREKIFDASIWVFVATLFHFWSIVFLLLVFLSILFHVSRDYRNWVLPFLAFFAVTAAFLLYAAAFDPAIIGELRDSAYADFSIGYFASQVEQGALSVYAAVALFFTSSMIFSVSARPLVVQASYKKVVAWFFLAVFIFLASPGKSNETLVFTFAPLAIMATAHIEFYKGIGREIALGICIMLAMVLYFVQVIA